MKVEIIKYLNSKGKILEMRKDNFKGRDLPDNIIEEYEVEIKGDSNETDWLEDLKIKYATGNYTLLTPSICGDDWVIVQGTPNWDCDNYILIHNKHKDIIEAYLKNHSVEIECTNYISKDADMETIWYLEEDFIENYDENFEYRLKPKDLAWYEDENIIGKIIYDGLNIEYCLVLKIKDNIIETSLDRKYHFDAIISSRLRPATESEVLSLVYKPQQKISKETTSTESDRLKDLFLNNEAECWVENEQEFNEVYDFLKNKNIKGLNLSSREEYNLTFPILIICENRWGNLFEWDYVKSREIKQPLIKYSNGVFSLVIQGSDI